MLPLFMAGNPDIEKDNSVRNAPEGLPVKVSSINARKVQAGRVVAAR
jgi:hypothetical protein